MNRFGLVAATFLGAMLVLVGCTGTGAKNVSDLDRVVNAAPPPSPSPVATPSYTGPHFDSPEAAMRYLAAAWNRHDITAMKRVTTPDGRAALIGMYDEAVNLRLDYCTARAGQGDYDCHFSHDYPAAKHNKGVGHAEFVAGPARNPGWYMTIFVTCG